VKDNDGLITAPIQPLDQIEEAVIGTADSAVDVALAVDDPDWTWG